MNRWTREYERRKARVADYRRSCAAAYRWLRANIGPGARVNVDELPQGILSAVYLAAGSHRARGRWRVDEPGGPGTDAWIVGVPYERIGQ